MRKHKKINKKVIILAVCALLVIAGAGIWFWQRNSDNKSTATTPVDIGGVNYNPPTNQEKQEAEQNKKDLEQKLGSGNTTPQTNTNTKQANVVITYSSSLETHGYVSNVFEEGGTCTITLTKGASKVTATSAGFTDVNKTTCGPLSYSNLTSGDWTAVLSYSSSTSSGSSAPTTVKVP